MERPTLRAGDCIAAIWSVRLQIVWQTSLQVAKRIRGHFSRTVVLHHLCFTSSSLSFRCCRDGSSNFQFPFWDAACAVLPTLHLLLHCTTHVTGSVSGECAKSGQVP